VTREGEIKVAKFERKPNAIKNAQESSFFNKRKKASPTQTNSNDQNTKFKNKSKAQNTPDKNQEGIYP